MKAVFHIGRERYMEIRRSSAMNPGACTQHHKLSVAVQRFVDDHFPGFVECILVDSDGCEHRIIEKVPVVTTANLSSDNAFPQPGQIACMVQDEWTDEQGRKLVRVSVDAPWGVESVSGKTTFVVFREQLTRD